MPFLFCFKHRPGEKKHFNQWRAIEICRKEDCENLHDGDQPTCSCPPSIEYFYAFNKKGKKNQTDTKKPITDNKEEDDEGNTE